MDVLPAVEIPDLLYRYYVVFGPISPDSWDEYLEFRHTLLEFKSKKRFKRKMYRLRRAYRMLYGKSELRTVIKITNTTWIDSKFRIILSERLSIVENNDL
jgi:hypothetical protein